MHRKLFSDNSKLKYSKNVREPFFKSPTATSSILPLMHDTSLNSSNGFFGSVDPQWFQNLL